MAIRWDQQITDLQDQLRNAVDALEVSALLESHGVTDCMAREHFRARDVFELGERLFARRTAQGQQPSARVSSSGWVPPHSTEMLVGWVKIIGTFILLAVIVALRVSPFWLSDQLITLAVSVGVGLVVSGGISPVFVRRMLFYHERAGPASAFDWFQKALPEVLWVVAGLGLLLSPLLALFADYFFPTAADLPLALVTVGAPTLAALVSRVLSRAYGSLAAFLVTIALVSCSWAGGSVVFECFVIFTLSTIFWLLVNTLYFLEQEAWFPIAAAVGLSLYLTVRELFRILRLTIPINLSLGIALVWGTAIVVMLAATDGAFRARIGSQSKGQIVRSRAPRLATARLYVGYLVFGGLYSALIVSDHLLAWVGYSAEGLSLIERISVYESTIFLVLLPFILPFQLTERVIRHFWEDIIREARPNLVERTRELYWCGLRRAFTWLILSDLLTFAVVAVVVSAKLLEARLPSLAATIPLLPVAMVAHAMLLWGGLNGFFLVSLSRLDAAITCLVPAIVVESSVGLLLSQGVDFSAAVVGLAAGSAVFALFTYREVRRTIAGVGYYYFRCLLSC